MKTLHLASILLLSAATAFACSDDDNNTPKGSAGAPSDAGAAGHDSVAVGGSDGEGGTPSGSSGETSVAVGGNDAAGSGGEAGGAALGGAGGEAAVEPFELIGEYDGGLDGPIVITSGSWNSSTIVEYDNAANVVYTQYPDDDDYNPNKFAKFVYTEPEDGSFFFCTIVYSADTLELAKANEAVADDAAPETGGCGSFPWSKAVPE